MGKEEMKLKINYYKEGTKQPEIVRLKIWQKSFLFTIFLKSSL